MKLLKKFIYLNLYFFIRILLKIPGAKKFQITEINASRMSNLVMETEIFSNECSDKKIHLIFFYKISNKYFVKLFFKKLRKKNLCSSRFFILETTL